MLYNECLKPAFRYTLLTLLIFISVVLLGCGHSTATFIAKGEECLQKRKFEDALMQFRSAVESDKDSAKAHWGMARSYEDLGQFNETLEELRKTVELDDSNLEAKTKLGNYFLLVQPPMIAETEAIRDQVLTADPSFIEAHILTASIMAAQGRPDAEVVRAVNKAIDMNPQRIESYISLERLYMTRERPVDAEAAIKRGLAANPRSVDGFIEYGKFLTYADRDAEADAQFHQAIIIGPDSIPAHEALAEFYVTSKQLELAEAEYKSLIEIQEDSPESRLELAQFYTKTGRNDDAIAILNQIVTDAPNYARARYRLGQIYLDLKDTVGVNEQLDALFKVNDEDTEALLLRARLTLLQNKPETAIKDIEEVLKKYPSGKDPLFLMAQARLALGQIDQGRSYISDLERYHPNYLKAGLLKIQASFSASEPENAVKQANELMAKVDGSTPNSEMDSQALEDLHVRALSSRGLAYLDLGKIAEAKADLQEIVKISPHSAAAMVNLAKVYRVENNYSGALELYNNALTADPNSFDAVSGIVASSISLAQTASAHAKTAELIAANEGRNDILAGLHYLKSTIFSAEKNPAAAEQELVRSIQLDNDYMPAYSAYASLLASQDRTDEAVAQYQKLIEIRPAAQAYTMLGILEDGRGNTSAAESNYRQALQLAPDSPIAANNLAWLIAENQGNLDEALQLATNAVSKSRAVAGYYDTLGWVYLKKGLYAMAVEQMKKAVAMDETNSQKSGAAATPGYRVRLGLALVKAGDKTSARREAETSLKNASALSQREVNDARSILASS